MRFIIEKSITGFYSTLCLDVVLSSYNGKNNLYRKYIHNGSAYFLKIEKWREGHELIEDENIRKVCDIDHQNILKYHDVLVVRKVGSLEAFIVSICDFVTDRNFLEYVTYLHQERCNLKPFLGKIIGIFDYLHSNGIIHKDINLSNFGLLCEEGSRSPILLDFNFYKGTSRELIGTPEFLDPTFDFNNDYNQRNERRSLAVFLYFLLTFDLPVYNRLTKKDLRGSDFKDTYLKKHLLADYEFELILKLLNND